MDTLPTSCARICNKDHHLFIVLTALSLSYARDVLKLRVIK